MATFDDIKAAGGTEAIFLPGKPPTPPMLRIIVAGLAIVLIALAGLVLRRVWQEVDATAISQAIRALDATVLACRLGQPPCPIYVCPPMTLWVSARSA